MSISRRSIIKRTVLVLAIWLLVTVGLGTMIPTFLNGLGGASFAVDGSPAQRTQDLLSSRFHSASSEQDLVVFHSNRLVASNPAYRLAVEQALSSLKGKPHVKSLISPYDQSPISQISSDEHTAFIIVGLSGSDSELQKNSSVLAGNLTHSTDDMKVYLTGASPLNADVIEQENSDLAKADTIGLPIAFLVLLIAFRSVIAASLPLFLGVTGVSIAFGVLGLLSKWMHFDVFVESAVTMLGLAFGIDYSLMIVTRFREELASGRSPDMAIRNTMRTAGKAVLFSGITVLISLSGLLLVRSPLFKGLGVGSICTVGVMLALSLTLLPIILRMLGKHINSLQILPHRRGAMPDVEQGYWARWAHFVMRRPTLVTLMTVILLVLMAWPVGGLQLGLNLGTGTLKDQPSAQGLRLIEQAFSPGLTSPIQVVASRSSGSFTDNDLAALSALSKRLQNDPRVASVSSPTLSLDALTGNHGLVAFRTAEQTQVLSGQVNIDQGSNVAIITVVPRAAADSETSIRLASDITSNMIPANTQSDLHFGLTGLSAQIVDLNAEVYRSLPVVLSFVLGLSFLLLAFNFRSLVLPLKAIVMNLFALSATIGLMVVVFQHGFGQHLLGFTSPGYIQSYLPLLTFVILFGLSMDYEVFLLTRIQEEWHKTHDNTAAVALGIEHTARVITNAAAIMIVVFASFLVARMLEIKQLGFALAIAVLIDATLIRLLLVPAAMRLLGRWNWWMPRWLGGRQDK
jgi:RND superfamily putative drug exporter